MKKGLKELENQRALDNERISSLRFCEEFILCKSSRTKFKNAVHMTKGNLDCIHSNLGDCHR